MEFFIKKYENLEGRILRSLKNNGIEHRTKANSGLWLGTLVGLSAIVTILQEDNSYSEICLVVGLTGFGLVISSMCLYLRLSTQKLMAKDFQVIYFLPSIITSMLYLLVANKGLLVSVIWGLSIGSLGTWGVLQLMSTFPRCFTIGEATAVTHSCILFLMSAVTNLALRYHLPPIHDTDIATVVLQVGILYVMTVCLLCGYLPFLHTFKNFYIATIGLFVFVTLPVMYIMLDQNPITWLLFFIFSDTNKIVFLAYSDICLLLSIVVITYQILSNSQATSSVRKTFHLLAVFVYIPGLIYEPIFLYLASGIILGLFVMLELMRFFRVPPLGETLQNGFFVFSDEKDNLISLTPLYLLCGLSFPLWMPTSSLPLLHLLSGVSTIGIGDAAASFVGSTWGSHKWTGSEKTVEGTIACILTQIGLTCVLALLGIFSFYLLFLQVWAIPYDEKECQMINSMFTIYGFVGSGWLLLRSVLASIAVSFVEAQTNQIDNLALPLLMYMCLTA